MRVWWEQTKAQSGLSLKNASYWFCVLLIGQCPPYWAIYLFILLRRHIFVFFTRIFSFCLSSALYCLLFVISLRISWEHAGIKSRATFDKYVLSLHITLKKPGIGSRRHYITWNDAELLRQLREMPDKLEELRYPPDAQISSTNTRGPHQ